MEHRLAQPKCEILTKHEIHHLVKDRKDQRGEEDPDKAAIKCEVKRLEKKFKRYSMSELGSMPTEKQ